MKESKRLWGTTNKALGLLPFYTRVGMKQPAFREAVEDRKTHQNTILKKTPTPNKIASVIGRPMNPQFGPSTLPLLRGFLIEH